MLRLYKRLKIPPGKEIEFVSFNLVFFQAWLAQVTHYDLREHVLGYVTLANILLVVSRTPYLPPQ